MRKSSLDLDEADTVCYHYDIPPKLEYIIIGRNKRHIKICQSCGEEI